MAAAARPVPDAAQLAGLRAGLRRPPAGSVRDASAPQLRDFAESAEEVREYQNSVLDINIEQWYDLIPEFTFPTEFVAISREAGQLFVDSFLAYEGHKKRVTLGQLEPTSEYVPPLQIQERVNTLLLSPLQAAVGRVRDAPEHPVFIKASSRSAKDAPTSVARLADIYRHELALCRAADDNTKLCCMLRAGLELLKAFSASDALDLFLRSERIYQDMLLALERPDRWDEHFAVRRWVNIDVGMEFRGFVHDGRLNALSQYNHLCYFPELIAQRDAILRNVCDFFRVDIRVRVHIIGHARNNM